MATAIPVSPTSSAREQLLAAVRRVQTLEERFAEFATQTNADGQVLTSRVAQLEGQLRQREEQIREIVDNTAAQRSSELAEVVAAARSEFEVQRTQMQQVASTIENEFQRIQRQLDAQGTNGDGNMSKGSYP